MLPLITFVVGIIVFFRGSLRLGSRTIVRPQTRSIGLILMAPLVIEFCASSLLVYNYVQFNDDGTFVLSADTLEYISGTLGVVELVAVVGAVGLALFMIFGRPPTALVPSASTSQTRGIPQQVPDIMTVTEAAAYMRVTETEVLELIDQGRLGAARIGSTYRIARIAVDDFMGRA